MRSLVGVTRMLRREPNVPTGEDSHGFARKRYGLSTVRNGIFTAKCGADGFMDCFGAPVAAGPILSL
jgi:hypothetical protein